MDVGMELSSLGWVLWRRAQALRENARMSALVPHDKNVLTKIGPTNRLFEPRVSYHPLYLVDLHAHCDPGFFKLCLQRYQPS